MTYAPGVQSFTYRAFSLTEMCSALEDTEVEAVELCHEHVTPADDSDAIADARETLTDAGLDVCGYGVAEFAGDPGEVEATLEMVADLGGEYLSCTFPPDDEGVAEALVDGASAFDLDVAVHNHGPESTYVTLAEVTHVLDRYPDDRLGACVDTGHFLRVGETPGEVVPAVGRHLHALHLTDYADGEREVVPGEGAVDVGELVGLLADHTEFDRPIVIEYEADAEEPTPAVRQTARAIVDAQSGER